MIRSMTGFGREQQIIDGREITVEVRSVNHRYHEFTAKTPHQYRYLEDKLKALAGQKVSRGKVEVSVCIHNISGKEVKVMLNKEVVESYLQALHELNINQPQIDFTIIDNFSLADVFRIPDAFTVLRTEVDEDAIWEAVKSVAVIALEKFVTMRETEGTKMKTDILDKLEHIEEASKKIEDALPEIIAKHREKLFEKMKEIVGNGADEQRILLEAALFAEKIQTIITLAILGVILKFCFLRQFTASSNFE